jgi:hypothetical protein
MTAQRPITYNWKLGRKLKRVPAKPPPKPINQDKVERVIAEKEKNIELELAAELLPEGYVYIVGGQNDFPKLKVDRQLEWQLYSALSMEERVEFSLRCKEKARAAWEAGDNFKKWKWGGW